MNWTATIGSESKALAEWGISGLQRRRSSQATDILSFSVEGFPIDEESVWVVEAEVVILRDEIPWFRGRITSASRMGEGNSERLQVTASGPWWYLERLVFQQTWLVYGGGEVRRGHCFLNQYADGSLMGTREQIREALEWTRTQALARYGSAPFTFSEETFPDIAIPIDEIRDITVAEVIRKQLRWMPDAVTWFDYSTTTPTFRVGRRSDLPTTSLQIGPQGLTSAIAITPRYDLQVPAVVIKYERIDTVDGNQIPVVVVDRSPGSATGEEFGALVATVDLVGFQINYATTTITTAPLPDGSDAWILWLKQRMPWLADLSVQIESVLGITRRLTDPPLDDPDSIPLLPRELTEGTIPEWLDAQSQSETVEFKLRLRILDANNQVIDDVEKAIAVNIVTTDAGSGTYRSVEQATAGEIPPTGLAAHLYAALSPLEYDGTITVKGAEIPDGLGVGQRLNIQGLRSEWTTMAAIIQEVWESVDDGALQIRFGPPQHLGPRDIVELLRVTRNRFVYTPRSHRTGETVSAEGIGVGGVGSRENAASGSLGRQRFVIRGGGGTIDLDAAMAAGHTIEVREVSICIDGIEKNMLLLCSEPY